MADYSTQIAALEAAVASGELTVEVNGERVTYRSMSDLMQALNYFQAKGSVSSSANPAPGVTLATWGEG